MLSRFTLSLSALALVAAGAPALAQVSATELWQEWQTQGLLQGRVLAAESVTPTGTGLTLNGFTSTFSDGTLTTVGRAETLTMTEQGDGTVLVTLPEVYEISVEFPIDPGDPPGRAAFEMRHDGMEIVAGGTAAERTYTYRADDITISGADLSGGPSGETPVVELAINIEGFTGDYLLNQANPESMPFSSSATMSSLSMAASVLPPPDEQGSLKFSFVMTDASTSGSGDIATIMAMADNPEALPEGLELATELTYGGLRLDIDFEEARDGFTVDLANEGGSFAFAYTETDLLYDVTTTEGEFSLTSVNAPIPIDISVGSSEIRLAMPIAPTGAPAPISARIAYQDLSMGEPIWGLFDPGQAIPRDPITVIFDAAGSVLVTTSLMEMSMGQMQGPPGELRALTINDVRVAAAGAVFTATGDMTFAPGQMIPQPVGSVELSLTGGNSLVQSLSGAGLVPPDQAAMAMGMAGAFARPGAQPDSLETTITFTEGGGITANGIPLQ